MSNPNEYQDNDDDSKPDPVRAQLKNVEARNKELEVLATKGAEAIRRLAFVDAGVDTSMLSAQDFVKAYDGDVTPDAIREAATARNLIAAKTDPVLEAEKEVAQRIGAARTAGEQSASVTDDVAVIDGAKTPYELDAALQKLLAGKTT